MEISLQERLALIEQLYDLTDDKRLVDGWVAMIDWERANAEDAYIEYLEDLQWP